MEGDPAGLHDVAEIGGFQRHIGVLLDKQHRHALLVDLLDDLKYALDDDGRKSQRRLVHHDDLGAAHQRTADRQHLLLAAGQGAARLP